LNQERDANQSASGNFIAQADRGGTASVNVINYGDISSRSVEPARLEAARRVLSEMPLEEVPEPVRRDLAQHRTPRLSMLNSA